MRRLLSRLGNLAAYAVIAAVLLAVLRPDLVPIPALRGEGSEPPEEAVEADATVAGGAVDDGWDDAHGAAGVPSRLHAIRLASPAVVQRIGLRTATAEARTVVDRVEGNAETAFDGHRYAEVVPRVACLVREVLADHGTTCRPGDRLAVVDAAEVGTAKATYLSARATAELAETTLERTVALSANDALPRAREIEARAALNTARAELLGIAQRLRNFGFSDGDLERIAERRDTSSLLDVVAPIAGTVVDLHAVIGEALDPTTVMFQVTDLSTLWAWIDVPEADFGRVRPGQTVAFAPAAGAEALAEGTVEWVDAAVNPVTRTVRVLAELDNPDGGLRANQFGWGSVAVGEAREAVVIPRDAVQDFAPGIGLVFVDRSDGSYRPQRVEVVPSGEPGMVEVAWGLRPGDEVVTSASFFLMSELRRDELAGD